MELEDLIPYLNKPHMYEKYIAAVCPWHDSEPIRQSLLIYPDRFRCKSCDATGTTEYLERFLQGQPPPIKLKDDEFQYPPYVNNLEKYALDCSKRIVETPHLGAYWIRRGISRTRAITCGLGFSQGWYTIPVRDPDMNIIRIVHRAGPKIERPIAKYYSTKGPTVPYCPDIGFSLNAYTLFVTYGMVDALALYQLGYASMTSSMGKGNFNPEWLRLSKAVHVVFIPDKGEGNTARLHAREFGPRASVLNLLYEFHTDCKDPADYLVNRPDSLKEQIELWLDEIE